MTTVADVIWVLEEFAPPGLAAGWDNVGLLLGDRAAHCERVLTCLTLTGEVAAEAAAGDYQLIVTHHPILFRGAKRITSDTAEGRALLTLARSAIAVYSPHTAFDNCPGGINDMLAAQLGLQDVRPLRPGPGPEQCKLVVFVPEADLGKVSDALFAAGAGVIGQYGECSFRLAGTGTFFGNQATNPTVGIKGRREEVSEWRLEVICPRDRLAAVTAAMRRAHSYEEPAFDVYSLLPSTDGHGAGRIGVLTTSTPLAELAGTLRTQLNCGPVQVVGDLRRPITTVAIACGAAGEFLVDCERAKAGAFVTGEMRFHDYLAARSAGVALLLPGHYATERFAVEHLATMLVQRIPGIHASASLAESDPVAWV